MTGSQRVRSRSLEDATPRQALHAARLGFQHPETREPVECCADWPVDLKDAVGVAAEDEDLLARDNVLEYLGFPG